MPITLNKIANNIATTAFQVGEDIVNITYYPNRVTGKLVEQMEGSADELNALLASLIKTWDIFEDDAETILLPIDADHLDALGLPIEIMIGQAILGDMHPNAPTA